MILLFTAPLKNATDQFLDRDHVKRNRENKFL